MVQICKILSGPTLRIVLSRQESWNSAFGLEFKVNLWLSGSSCHKSPFW